MKPSKPNARPGTSKPAAPPTARRRAKAAEAPRDPKITVPVAASEAGKPTEKPANSQATARDAAPKPVAVEAVASGTPKPAPVPPASVAASEPPKPARPPFKATGGDKAAKPSPVLATAAPKPVRDLGPTVQAAMSRAVEAVLPATVVPPPPRPAAAPLATTAVDAGADSARRASAPLPANDGAARVAMTATATAAARGVSELNGKMLTLLQAQNDAAFALWRDTVTARSFPEAMRAQTSGLRHLYETSAAQWRDVAQTVARLMNDAAGPMTSVWTNRRS